MQPKFINNFISKETALAIHEYLKPKAKDHVPDGPHPKGMKHLSVSPLEKFDWAGLPVDNPIMFDLINLITDSISNQFNLKKDEIGLKTIRYTLFNKGQSLRYHDDFQVSGYHVYSAVLYLNEDYEGGEILFYDFDSEINPEIKPTKYHSYKPDAGTLIYFDGDLGHPHEVNPVISGERANFVLFYEGVVEKEGRF